MPLANEKIPMKKKNAKWHTKDIDAFLLVRIFVLSLSASPWSFLDYTIPDFTLLSTLKWTSFGLRPHRDGPVKV